METPTGSQLLVKIMATGDIPFKKQNPSGEYDNKSLPADSAEFRSALQIPPLPIATTPETLAGLALDKASAPAGVKAAIDAATFAGSGYVPATINDAEVGTSNDKVITPMSGRFQIEATKRVREIQRWWNSLTNSQTTRVSLVPWGDSYGMFKTVYQMEKLWRDYGFGGYLGVDFTYLSYILENGAAYTSTQNAGDFLYWPTASYFSVPSGATVTRQLGNGLLFYKYTQIQIWYWGEPGAGTFKVQSRSAQGAWTDESGYTAIDATATSGVQSISITKSTADQWQFRIIGLSGGTTKFQMGVFNPAGVAVVDITRGGELMTNMVTWTPATAAVVLGFLNPKLFTIEMNDTWSTGTPLPSFEALLTASGVGMNTDVCYVGAFPNQSESTVATQNALLLQFARDNGRAYWDGNTLGISYASLFEAFGIPLTVTGLTRSGSTASLAVASLQGASASYSVLVRGADQTDYNKMVVIGSTDATHIFYPVSNSPTTPATGTIVAKWIDGGHLNQAQEYFSDAWARDLRLFGNQLGQSKLTTTARKLKVQDTLILSDETQVRTRLVDSIFLPKTERGGLGFAGASSAHGPMQMVGVNDLSICMMLKIPSLADSGTFLREWWATSSSSSTGSTGDNLHTAFDTTLDRLTIGFYDTPNTGLRCRKVIDNFCATYGQSATSSGQHLMVIKRSVAGAELYVSIDGIPINAQQNTGTGTWADSINSSQFWLASGGNQLGIYSIYELAIYSRFLTQTEEIAYAATGIAPANQEVFTRLNANTGTIAYDLSGNARDMTISNSTTWLRPLSASTISPAVELRLKNAIFHPKQLRGGLLSDNSWNMKAPTPAVGTSDFWFACWAYIPTVAEAGSFFRCIGGVSNSTSGGLGLASSFQIEINTGSANGTLEITLNNGTNTGNSKKSLTQFHVNFGGDWHFLMFRRLSGGMFLEIDNVPQVLASSTSGGSAWSDPLLAGFFYFAGGHNQNAQNYKFAEVAFGVGSMTQFGSSLYYTTGLVPATVTNYYQFDEGFGTSARDYSGLGNNLAKFNGNCIWLHPSWIRSLPTADPHIVGYPWANAGVVTISAG